MKKKRHNARPPLNRKIVAGLRRILAEGTPGHYHHTKNYVIEGMDREFVKSVFRGDEEFAAAREYLKALTDWSDRNQT